MRQSKKSWGEKKSDEVKENSKKKHQTDSNNNQSVFETDTSSASTNSNQPGSSPNTKHSKTLPHISQTLNNKGLSSPSNRTGSESCPEFRSGYRIQTKAYERRSETPPLSVTVSNHRYSNAYVDILKQFYQDENDWLTQGHKSEPNSKKYFDNFPPVLNRQDMSTNSSKLNSNPKSSVDRLPSFIKNSTAPISHNPITKHDIFISNNPRTATQSKKPPHPRVTITLTSPSGKTSTPDDNLIYNNTSDKRHKSPSQHIKTSQSNGQNTAKHESVTNQRHTPKYRPKEVSFAAPFIYPNIPPPVPILIPPSARHAPSAQSPHRNWDGSELNHSDSLTSSDAKSILEAVQTLGSGRSSTASSAKNQQRRKRLSRAALEKDSKNIAMKMSLPCRVGCCYCVYASLLGPVKIYLTRGEKPKKEPWLLGIKDGHGRPVIPVSRKEDITGLVYDAHNHSFHPPSRGQRPMFPSSAANKGTRLIRTPVSKGRGSGGKHGGT